MKRSTERILTTHAGSLPRPDHVLALLVARDRQLDYDEAALEAAVGDAVAVLVHKQIDTGIDVVNDGEVGKIGYGAYVKERLSGFAGAGAPPLRTSDLDEFPAYFERLYGPEGFGKMERPLCNGPIAYMDAAAPRRDADVLKAALAGLGEAEGFLSAASPGTVSIWLGNDHYASHEDYVWAIAEAMKIEYDAIHAAGLVLQIDAPDLAMGRHMQFADADLATFRRNAAMCVEALNYATRDIPADAMRLHLCWGNYDGPHHHDVELRDIIDIVLAARPGAISFEGANPRHEHEWAVWAEHPIPDDKILLPGVINSVTHFIEHPDLVAERICRYAGIVGRERVIACTDCGMSTQAGFDKVDADIGWAKYGAMAEGARRASRRLWP